MAYVRHNWTCGEVINDTRMNNIEDGIEEALNGGGLVLRVARTEPCPEGYSGSGTRYFDATWQQVKDAYDAGIPVYLQIEKTKPDYSYRFNLISIDHADSEVGYRATFCDGNTMQVVVSDSPTEELHSIDHCQPIDV